MSLAVLSSIHGLSVALVACLICRPMSAAWDTTVRGTCGDQVLSYVVLEVLGLILDCGILIIPLPVVINIQLPVRKKLGVCCILCCGFL